MARDQKGQTNRSKNYRYLYGRDEDEKEIEYEVTRLPLEEKIAVIRRATTKNWKYVQVFKFLALDRIV